MPVAPGLTDCAASVAEADPRLAPLLSAHAAVALAHAPLLPVLTVSAGEWRPPPRDALGPQARCLAILAGLLVHDGSSVLGPGDLVDPWRGDDAWRVCTPARLAVVGGAFAAAVEAWPDVVERAARPRPRPLSLSAAAGAAPEARLLELLWGLARRWAQPSAYGLALSGALDAAALAWLLDLPSDEVGRALGALLAQGAVLARGDGGWLLPPPPDHGGPRSRHERLRAQLAEQCAVARVACEDAEALCELLGSQRRPRRA